MKKQKIGCVFHYIPLHKAPFAKANCRVSGQLVWTERLAERLVRLPLWIGMEKTQKKIISKTKAVIAFSTSIKKKR